ncbi:MAG: hypothetical protein AB1646_22460 [Thermodesulfobacteriota bacterium]
MDISVDLESRERTVIYFPIVHNQADMGALSESVKKASLKRIGRTGWKRKLDLIDKFWTEIGQSIDRLSLPVGRVRIYQDGLPVSGKEREIVEELAKSGSRNHALLLRLIDGGAQLMGTESLELLLEEYELARKALEWGVPPETHKSEKPGTVSLLERRDTFIARRINDTLRPGEIGMVFLGMLHSLEKWLERDIQVIYPLGRPMKR